MRDFGELEQVLDEVFGPYDVTEEVVEAIRVLLDNRYEGLIVVDREGRVVFMNRENERFLSLARGGAKGRPIEELVPSSRLHVVCKTGRAEVAHLQEIQGKAKVVARIPLKKGARVVGAMGSVMFQGLDEVTRLVRRLRVLEDRVADYEKKLKTRASEHRYTFDEILGGGQKLQDTVALARRVAASDATVVLIGETGTGKELFAHAIHTESPRAGGPFIRLNCAAIPRELAESELFGYAPGAFSGASRGGKPGKFEQADGGTIFLDEIGELPLDIQAKLLRVLQEKEVERVGGTAPRRVDFRLVAASNVDLKELTEDGRFRLDLYFRLSKMVLSVPSLREHPEDIALYASHFLESHASSRGAGPRELDDEVLRVLRSYSWPGNVRELVNVVERAAWNATGPRIRVEDLPPIVLSTDARPDVPSGSTLLRDAVERAEKQLIERVLAMTGHNKSRACRLLDIHRTTLYEKLARYKIEVPAR
ncbi:MAG: sigma 54-interacting transcriptional regulator [Deltaproteobacteria bacterium]|nr:sigma 54-interacting transcriptional regulator [Deltaproteobacteria bacterium]